MAASILTWRLSKAFSLIQSTGQTNLELFPRVLTQVHLTRGSRRSCKAPRWWPKQKVNSSLAQDELTPESQQFLQRVVEEKYGQRETTSPLRSAPLQRHPWTRNTMRCGVLAIKIGVMPQWTKDGERFTCTLLQVLDNHVVRYVPPEVFAKSPSYKDKWRKNTYGSIVVGALSTDPFKYSKRYNDQFAEAGLPPKRKMTRFIVTPDAAIEPGTPLKATHFKVGDYVDCQAKTIGHGFQGVVKRWGFKGGPASHGTTKWHRRVGSIAGGKGGSVWPGRKMPGHMGMQWRTLKGLKIYRINTKYNVLYVKGQNIPGPNHCYVRITDCVMHHRRKERQENQPHMPTYYHGDITPLPEEIFDDTIFQFTQPTITFTDKEK